MARKRTPAKKSKINLPPFPWETHVTLNGNSVSTARPNVEQADIALECERSPDGEVVQRRARVWRTTVPPIMKTLNPAGRAAMLDFAEALERVGSSGGTSDPTGGGGGGGGARSPSHTALMAAERLRAMERALSGHEMAIELNPQSRRNTKRARASYRDIAEWVAVDGMARHDILKRIGAPPRGEVANSICTVAIAEVGRLLSVCCGYEVAPVQEQKKRNTAGREL